MATRSTRSHAQSEAGFSTLEEIQRDCGVSDALLRRRVRQRGVEVFRSGHDRRRRLIRNADVEALFQPRPAVERPGATAN